MGWNGQRVSNASRCFRIQDSNGTLRVFGMMGVSGLCWPQVFASFVFDVAQGCARVLSSVCPQGWIDMRQLGCA